jgi:hypothetical protein
MVDGVVLAVSVFAAGAEATMAAVGGAVVVVGVVGEGVVGVVGAVVTGVRDGGAALLPDIPCTFCETMICAGELSGLDAVGPDRAHPAAPTRAAATDTPTMLHVFIQGPGFCAPRRTPAVDGTRAELRKAH